MTTNDFAHKYLEIRAELRMKDEEIAKLKELIEQMLPLEIEE